MNPQAEQLNQVIKELTQEPNEFLTAMGNNIQSKFQSILNGEHMKELNQKNEYATQFVQDLIDGGQVIEDEDEQLVLARGPNLIGNANEFS